ncbi:hypothetical protein FJ366_01380 [Candidatus Dependentiae bacterium]|nr:hypothetical protein [Candidatus Dependentiae bacterium]
MNNYFGWFCGRIAGDSEVSRRFSAEALHFHQLFPCSGSSGAHEGLASRRARGDFAYLRRSSVDLHGVPAKHFAIDYANVFDFRALMGMLPEVRNFFMAQAEQHGDNNPIFLVDAAVFLVLLYGDDTVQRKFFDDTLNKFNWIVFCDGYASAFDQMRMLAPEIKVTFVNEQDRMIYEKNSMNEAISARDDFIRTVVERVRTVVERVE